MATKKKQPVTKKRSTRKNSSQTSQETCLVLTIEELTFLRDLMSLLLPPDGQITAAKVLGQLTESEEQEQSLWHKIYDACENVNLPVGEDAPDYLIAQTMGLSIYQVSKED